MKLVKIGHVVLNFDQVTYIKDPGDGAIMVEFAGNKCLDVIAHAGELRSWLSANVASPTPTSASPASPSPGTA